MKPKFKYLPYEKYTLISSLSPEDLQAVLLARTARYAPKNYSFTSGKRRVGSRHFEGEIDGMQFEISPVITYRNSFKPTAKGKIQKLAHGSSIEINCQMNKWVYLFMSIWMGFILLFLLISIASFANGSANPKAAIIPAIMAIFGYGLALGGFKYESISLRHKLMETLNAEMNQG